MSDEGNEAEAHSANVQSCGGNKIPDQVNPKVDLETHQKVVPGMITISPAVVNGPEIKVGEVLHLEGTQGPANLQTGMIVSTLQDHGCPGTPQQEDNVGTLRDSDGLTGVISSDDDDDDEFDLIMDITSADQQTSAQDDHHNHQSDLIQFGSFESASSSSSAPITQPVQSRFASSSLYIADLNVNASEAYLIELFSLVGEVESVRICHGANTGLPLGRGYVKFRTVEQATNALANLNYTSVNGEPMRLMYSMVNSPARSCSDKANVFIKNLDASIDTRALHETFSAFGFVLSCKVAVDACGQSKGHGFVQFEDEESARIAIEKVNGMLMENRKVSVLPFVPRVPQMVAADHHEFTNVYVKNFTITVSEEDLVAVFSKFGAIKSTVVMRDGQGMSKCFGFVDFHDHTAAAEAIVALDGKTSAIDGCQWYVGRAQKREERIKLLLSKFHRQDQLDTQQTMSRDDLEDDHRWSTRRVSNNFDNIINSDHLNSGNVRKKKRRQRGKRNGRKSKHLQDQIDKVAPPAALIEADQVVAMSSDQCVAFDNDLQKEVEAAAADSPSQVPSDCSAGGGIDPSHPQESDDAILTSALVSAVAADERLGMLGGRLYPLLEQFEQEHGTEVSLYLLVRVGTNEIRQLTGSPTALQARIDSSKQVVVVVPQAGAQEGPARDVIPVPGLMMSLQMM